MEDIEPIVPPKRPKELTNEEYLDQMFFCDKDGNRIINEPLDEMIKMAKNSEHGGVWFSEKGPIQITKDGQLLPIQGLKYTYEQEKVLQ